MTKFNKATPKGSFIASSASKIRENQNFLKSTEYKSKLKDLDSKKGKKSPSFKFESKVKNYNQTQPNSGTYLKMRSTSKQSLSSNRSPSKRTPSNKIVNKNKDDEFDDLSNVPCDEKYINEANTPSRRLV